MSKGNGELYREVSNVLNTRPNIFSVAPELVLPALAVTGAAGIVSIMIKSSITLAIINVLVFNAVYFFLFGREWWRLAKKFKRPPMWIRTNVQAIPFVLRRNEKKSNPSEKTTKNTKRKRERR